MTFLSCSKWAGWGRGRSRPSPLWSQGGRAGHKFFSSWCLPRGDLKEKHKVRTPHIHTDLPPSTTIPFSVAPRPKLEKFWGDEGRISMNQGWMWVGVGVGWGGGEILSIGQEALARTRSADI